MKKSNIEKLVNFVADDNGENDQEQRKGVVKNIRALDATLVQRIESMNCKDIKKFGIGTDKQIENVCAKYKISDAENLLVTEAMGY